MPAICRSWAVHRGFAERPLRCGLAVRSPRDSRHEAGKVRNAEHSSSSRDVPRTRRDLSRPTLSGPPAPYETGRPERRKRPLKKAVTGQIQHRRKSDGESDSASRVS